MPRRKEASLFPLPIFLGLYLCQCRSASSSGASESDTSAMWELAKGLSGLPPTWKPDTDPCSWDGVTCSAGRVSSISLVSSGISGSLPSSLSSLDALTSLRVQHNRISGPFPLLSKFSSLQSLFLSDNAFKSLPKGFFAGLTALQSLYLDDLPLDPWSLSHDLAAAAGLTELSASNCSLQGTLPDSIGSLRNLRRVRLSYNHLSGKLPSSLAGSYMQQLFLNNQQSSDKLSGRIDVIGAMPQLTVLWLHSNSFTGPIPDLSNLTALESLNLRNNLLTGVVPASLTGMPTLKNVTLSNNQLQGPVPKFASSVVLDVKGNGFCKPTSGPCDPRVTMLLAVAAGFGYPALLARSWTGDDPCSPTWLGVTCDSQKNIVVLNFANQRFDGEISPAIANLTSLRYLILSNNNLVGSIPESLTRLPQLQVLDVSNNKLSGKLPPFASSVTVKLEGNPGIGSETGDDSSRRLKSRVWISGIIIALVVLFACPVALFLHYRKKKQKNNLHRVPTEPDSFQIGFKGLHINTKGFGVLNSQSSYRNTSLYSSDSVGMQMSFHSLQRATNNFSEANVLGRGGFGVVYKGNHNGMLIAVKRNEHLVTGKKGNEEFKAEIDFLRKVRHKNLVALLGYCNGRREQLLVYECMSGGTLGEHLYEWQSRNEAPLTWKQRLAIALDVARGIEYLHSLCQETFIHRDLKPSNILLDKETTRAKVSDFGLVKLVSDNQKSMMTRLAGTFGYLAPEYATTGNVTTKVDVYAFGVILMELITGSKVLDESLPPEDCHLVALFRRRLFQEKENFLKIMADPVLDLDEEAHHSLAEVADLAWHCTAREPHQRPEMSHCVNWLAPLVEQWKPSDYSDRYDDDDYDDGSSISLPDMLQRWQDEDISYTTDTFDNTFK